MDTRTPLIICIRNTLNWARDTGPLVYPKGQWHKSDRNLEWAMRAWKRLTYNFDYRKFRSDLKRIAMMNWMEVDGLTMIIDATSIDIRKFVKSLNSLYNDYLLLPTDDDDWFRPDILSRLQPHVGSKCLSWHGIKFDTVNHRISDFAYPDYPESNGYALTKRLLATIPPEHWETVIKVHTDVYKVCEPKLLDDRLSMYNFHCGSISYLIHAESSDVLRRLTCPDISGHEWTRPYIEKFISVVDEVYQSRYGLLL